MPRKTKTTLREVREYVAAHYDTATLDKFLKLDGLSTKGSRAIRIRRLAAFMSAARGDKS